MYLHLGGDMAVNQKSIIGIFNLETATISKITRDYLKRAQKRGIVENIGYEIPTSFVVCSDRRGDKVYTTQISSQTLYNRTRTRRMAF
ncbi:MAG: DUF370 domain-containing protein [Clostridia bacterium]|nr:DUF370 domain-containing protein [Clostridia bacterium]